MKNINFWGGTNHYYYLFFIFFADTNLGSALKRRVGREPETSFYFLAYFNSMSNILLHMDY